jgi:hypothetical protein
MVEGKRDGLTGAAGSAALYDRCLGPKKAVFVCWKIENECAYRNLELALVSHGPGHWLTCYSTNIMSMHTSFSELLSTMVLAG